MLICGDFPKASCNFGSFFFLFSFQGTFTPPSLLLFSWDGVWKGGPTTFSWVCEAPSPFCPLSITPGGTGQFWFSPESRSILRSSSWLPLTVKLISSFLQSCLSFLPVQVCHWRSGCLKRYTVLPSNTLKKNVTTNRQRCSVPFHGLMCRRCFSSLKNFWGICKYPPPWSTAP